MTLTEREIFAQYEALAKTYDAMASSRGRLEAFLKKSGRGKIIFTGCGSGYSLAKSAAAIARVRLDASVYAFAAGDLLLNYEAYARLLKDAVLVVLSRSGSTSEVVMLLEKARRGLGVPCLSVCAKEKTPLAALSDEVVEIPWAFDESVCQTRCVSNLYLAGAMLAGFLAEDAALLESLANVVGRGDAYMREHCGALQSLADREWGKVVVLADGELEGIAEEGALAFTEIALMPSSYYHLLDVRHGPMVLVDGGTLVIAALTPGGAGLQDALLQDIKKRGATLVVFSDRASAAPHADYSVNVPPEKSFAAQGIPFVFLAQALSLFKALHNGVDPDKPAGLAPWIKLRV